METSAALHVNKRPFTFEKLYKTSDSTKVSDHLLHARETLENTSSEYIPTQPGETRGFYPSRMGIFHRLSMDHRLLQKARIFQPVTGGAWGCEEKEQRRKEGLPLPLSAEDASTESLDA